MEKKNRSQRINGPEPVLLQPSRPYAIVSLGYIKSHVLQTTALANSRGRVGLLSPFLGLTVDSLSSLSLSLKKFAPLIIN